MGLVTIIELCGILDVSKQYLSKMKPKVFFSKCYDDKNEKLYLKKALETIINNSKTTTGKLYINARIKQQELFYKTSEEKENTAEDIENLEELKDLLESEPINSVTRVTIIQKFWAGKREEIKAKEEAGDLISIAEAKSTFDKVLTPFNQMLNDLPILLKEKFPNTDDDAILWLMEHINNTKTEFQEE